MKVFYFGCWGDVGHYLWSPSAQHARTAGPWTERDLDTSPIDSRGHDTGRGVVPADPEQREHVWRLTHKDGWTAIGAWDRTADQRRGSVSVFVAEGEHDESTMRGFAASYFPAVYSRIMRSDAERMARQ